MPSYASVYPPAHNATYVKSSSIYSALFYPYFATDPAKSVTGSYNSNAWMATAGQTGSQKFNIDLGAETIVSRLYLENQHSSGLVTTYGLKDFLVYGTNSAAAFANTTYADLTDLTLIGSFSAAAHVAADTADPQYFAISSGGVAYRYYVIRIVNNWGASYVGFRRVELQVLTSGEGDLVTPAVDAGGMGSGFGGASIGAVSISGETGGTGSASIGAVDISGTDGGGADLGLGAVDGAGVAGGIGGLSLGNLSVAGEGSVGALLEVTGQLFQLQGGISLNSEAVAELAGKLFELKGGFQIDEIEVTGQLFQLQGGFSIERDIPIEMSGKLFELQGGVDVAGDVLVELGGQLFELQGGMSAETAIPFEIAGQLFELKGTMTAVAIEPDIELSGQLFELHGGITFAGAGECSGVLSYSPGGSC